MQQNIAFASDQLLIKIVQMLYALHRADINLISFIYLYSCFFHYVRSSAYFLLLYHNCGVHQLFALFGKFGMPGMFPKFGRFCRFGTLCIPVE